MKRHSVLVFMVPQDSFVNSRPGLFKMAHSVIFINCENVSWFMVLTITQTPRDVWNGPSQMQRDRQNISGSPQTQCLTMWSVHAFSWLTSIVQLPRWLVPIVCTRERDQARPICIVRSERPSVSAAGHVEGGLSPSEKELCFCRLHSFKSSQY